MATRGRSRAGTRRLTIHQTPTGYWVVQRDGVSIARAMTRKAAEAERELLRRLADRSLRRRAGAAPTPRA